MSKLDEYLDWFAKWEKTPSYLEFRERPVAYFCAEFALDNNLPTYCGGLGVLAGDLVREAADRGLPLIAVGLYYRHGFLCPLRTVNGELAESCPEHSPKTDGLELATKKDGTRLAVHVPIQDRQVEIQAWKWTRGDVSVYLLDSDLDSNSPSDRKITDRLYVADKETRLKQEIILGIGGLCLIEALGIHPRIYHLNEGHSAFLGLELIRHEMEERGLNFDEAVQFARRRLVLTNHTLVPAGHETYSDDLVSLLLGNYAEKLGVPINDLVKFGLVQDSSVFSLSIFAMRLASIVNAVSKLHAQKAKIIWRDHPMTAITNGIHLPTWDRIKSEPAATGELWQAHQSRKKELLDKIEAETGRRWPAETLLIGWARRFASYKRPLAILEDVSRFAALARNADRPFRIIFSGQPHPSDEDGKKLLSELRTLVDGELRDVAAYLPNYDLDASGALVSGCDVWLNTPVVGYEACGTSGMKAALNGGLPLSTCDGWVAEIEISEVGWLLNNECLAGDILGKIDNDIAPLYYDRDSAAIPIGWESKMKKSRRLIQDRFSATRMLHDYLEMLYL